KTCGADQSDTAKQEGYKSWLDSQEVEHRKPVLLAVDAKEMRYAGDFQFVAWANLCLELRRLVAELRDKNKFLACSMILAFVGAVEQNLLGLSAKSVKQIRAGRGTGFNSKILEHLEKFLG